VTDEVIERELVRSAEPSVSDDDMPAGAPPATEPLALDGRLGDTIMSPGVSGDSG